MSGQPLDRRVGYQLKRAQQALRHTMESELRTFGLGAAQYAALNVLQASPEISSAELARRCFVTPQTMAGLLGGLRSAGLVERNTSPTHGRVLATRLTPAGDELLAAARTRVTAIDGRVTERLSAHQLDQLRELLRHYADALESTPGDRRHEEA